ncbi:polysaccharide pyruvyl transferase family protein [Candidatus Proelusimicrobium volucris]|uniref:polysaccharide pyruvyl transferase family protein n=1 Tax=Candidatus Proelusimicrobium volucris TaxID=3416225 RepID=UPI003D09FD29
MRKTGILTYVWANNYGAVLQAYALKKTISLLGAESLILNYRGIPNKKNIKQFVKRIFFPIWNFRVRRNFKSFRDIILKNSFPLKRDNLPALNDKFDIFITGSDQVWNFFGNGFDSSYLLDFVRDNNKKYSYAASFGRPEITPEEEALCAPLLKLFARISVREDCGVPLAERLSSKSVRRDIDPTLLLTKNEWLEVAQMPDRENYVLLYLMSHNAKIIDYAKELGQKKGLKVVMITTSPIPRKGIEVLMVTPQEWLGYFLKAKYVVTNSFHGLAFSINFNKDFFVDLLPPPSNVNSRLENLLELTGLKGRLIDNICDNYEEEISWGRINAIIERERLKSFSYLGSIIR